MKKVNIRIVSFVIMILSILLTSGLAINEAIAPGSGGWAPDPDSDGG